MPRLARERRSTGSCLTRLLARRHDRQLDGVPSCSARTADHLAAVTADARTAGHVGRAGAQGKWFSHGVITSADNNYVNSARFLRNRGSMSCGRADLGCGTCQSGARRSLHDRCAAPVDRPRTKTKPLFASSWTQQRITPTPWPAGEPTLDFFHGTSRRPTPMTSRKLFERAPRGGHRRRRIIGRSARKRGLADETMLVITGQPRRSRFGWAARHLRPRGRAYQRT